MAWVRIAVVVLVLVVSGVSSVPLLAQLPTGTFLGVVKDQSGGVVPDATVTVQNAETGLTRSATTAGDGAYRVSALPVGRYTIKIEKQGFQVLTRTGLTLDVSQEVVANATLQVGASTQEVVVNAEAPLVNTTSGALGGLVNDQRMAELPLNGRNFVDLTLLQPGVSQSVTSSAGTSTTIFSSNGSPVYSNNFLLDGTPLQTRDTRSAGTTLGVDGIQEYRVVTNSFSAEYGLMMGSQVMIVSKGGSNTFHGSLFEFLRNSALDARNFFDVSTVASPGRLPPFKRNNFGGSFGGPLVKDRTFFFGVYEGLRQHLGVTTLAPTIPMADRVDGGLVPVISPITKPWIAIWPEPNVGSNLFTYPATATTSVNYGQMRVDHSISTSDTMFVRYTVNDDDLFTPDPYPGLSTTGTGRNQYVTISESHVFSPRFLNTARFSFARTSGTTDHPSAFSGPDLSFVTGLPMGKLTIGGLTGTGSSTVGFGSQTGATISKQNIFTYSDDVAYTIGKHSLRFGSLINRYQQYNLGTVYTRGEVDFPNLTAFLLAEPSRITATTPGSITDKTYHFTTFGFYIQDDFRVAANLTLNMGLRYEFMTTMQEAQGRGTAIRNIRTDAAPTLGPPMENSSLRNFGPRFGFAWDVQGNGKTSLRGGFGLLYDLANMGNIINISSLGTPPYGSTSQLSNPPTFDIPLTFPSSAIGKSLRTNDYLMQQPHMLQFNLTAERQLPGDMALTIGYVGSRGLNLTQAIEGNPTIPQILADGQPFWPAGNNPRVNPNWAAVDFRTAGGESWYNALQVGLIKRLSHGLQFQSSYTWSKTLDDTQGQIGPSDDLSSSGRVSYPMNPQLDWAPSSFDVAQNWRFNVIYHLPRTGLRSAAGAILNGWWVSTIVSIQSGYPFTPGIQGDRSHQVQFNQGIDHPNLVPGRSIDSITHGVSTAGGTTACPTAGEALGTPDLWFDPCAFSLQPAGFLGNAGRSILRGPGLANLDFSAVKDTRLGFLGESGNLEFRAEFFNFLNRANFGQPSRFVFAGKSTGELPLSNAGLITNTITTSRQIQLALKVLF